MHIVTQYPKGVVVGTAVVAKNNSKIGYVLTQQGSRLFLTEVIYYGAKLVLMRTSDRFDREQALSFTRMRILNITNIHKYTLLQNEGELQSLNPTSSPKS